MANNVWTQMAQSQVKTEQQRRTTVKKKKEEEKKKPSSSTSRLNNGKKITTKSGSGNTTSSSVSKEKPKSVFEQMAQNQVKTENERRVNKVQTDLFTANRNRQREKVQSKTQPTNQSTPKQTNSNFDGLVYTSDKDKQVYAQLQQNKPTEVKQESTNNFDGVTYTSQKDKDLYDTFHKQQDLVGQDLDFDKIKNESKGATGEGYKGIYESFEDKDTMNYVSDAEKENLNNIANKYGEEYAYRYFQKNLRNDATTLQAETEYKKQQQEIQDTENAYNKMNDAIAQMDDGFFKSLLQGQNEYWHSMWQSGQDTKEGLTTAGAGLRTWAKDLQNSGAFSQVIQNTLKQQVLRNYIIFSTKICKVLKRSQTILYSTLLISYLIFYCLHSQVV